MEFVILIKIMEKEFITKIIKVSDILAKQLKIWQKLCIISNIIWLVIAIAFGIMAYIYFYNTDTIIETTTQEGIQTLYKGYDNQQIITSDENISKLYEELNNGKTNNQKNN